MSLRHKKELIIQFIASLNPASNVDDEWIKFVDQKRKEELDEIIEQEDLDPKKTYKFMQNAFSNGFIEESGTGLAEILPPISRFTADGQRTKKKSIVLNKLKQFFERYFDISSSKI